MKKQTSILVFGIVLLGLSGCGRLIDWAEDVFYQGEPIDNDTELARQYIRRIKIYDQFTTRGIFDIIWLSDPVREAYAELHAIHFGKQEEHKRAFLRRQLEENNYYISFYVLSLNDIPLGTQDGEWTIFITVNGINYFPTSVRSIDLPYEYRKFFGCMMTAFKTSYLVVFDSKNVEGIPILSPCMSEMTMQFRSADKVGSVSWRMSELGTVICDETCKTHYIPMRKRCIHERN